MKLYITEYLTEDSTVRQIIQHNSPEFPDKKIGDKLLTNHISDHETFCIGCGKENKTYYTKEHEIVEIRQYVEEELDSKLLKAMIEYYEKNPVGCALRKDTLNADKFIDKFTDELKRTWEEICLK